MLTLTQDIMNRILVDVALGKPAPKDEPAEEAEFRRKMVAGVKDIADHGHELHVPSE